jgi:hypothetical protein
MLYLLVEVPYLDAAKSVALRKTIFQNKAIPISGQYKTEPQLGALVSTRSEPSEQKGPIMPLPSDEKLIELGKELLETFGSRYASC